ncbi:hypothetical protein [Desulforamulus ruminis]|uniref:Uncharacterized protein n=1 Tax=Desulforamulus ruminis (strain ATCC 23193 / DSM 2154 / NCIMB 8452 / DL) TaxID=696281 RepID=F6DUY1_DESRL|nr:hypothetical protein [Desulforamulus ruminis]AEG61378.1 hypothetical protein Desru_3167 [Desulforamulus ruminis DSM 2154]
MEKTLTKNGITKKASQFFFYFILAFAGILFLLVAEFVTELFFYTVLNGKTERLFFHLFWNGFIGLFVAYCLLFVISRVIPNVTITKRKVVFGAIAYTTVDMLKFTDILPF